MVPERVRGAGAVGLAPRLTPAPSPIPPAAIRLRPTAAASPSAAGSFPETSGVALLLLLPAATLQGACARGRPRETRETPVTGCAGPPRVVQPLAGHDRTHRTLSY